MANTQEPVETEKVAKIVENALTSDFMLQVMSKVFICCHVHVYCSFGQAACIHGLLYLSEEPSSAILLHCLPNIAKYTIACFQEYHRYVQCTSIVNSHSTQ